MHIRNHNSRTRTQQNVRATRQTHAQHVQLANIRFAHNRRCYAKAAAALQLPLTSIQTKDP